MMRVCVIMCVCVYIYIYACMHSYIHTHSCMHAYIHTYLHAADMLPFSLSFRKGGDGGNSVSYIDSKTFILSLTLHTSVSFYF